MRRFIPIALALAASAGGVCRAQFLSVGRAVTPEGDYLRGVGAAAMGMGYFNLSTAQANSINVNTEIRWENWLLSLAQYETQSKAEYRAAMWARNQENRAAILARIRDKPEERDLQNGDALNALLDQLNDPKIHESSYRSRAAKVPLPADAVRRIPFRLNEEAAEFSMQRLLPRGRGKWPVALQDDQFLPERQGYERAVDEALEQQITGKMSFEAIRGVDAAVEALQRKVEIVLGPGEDQLRREARNRVRELRRSAELLRSHRVELAVGELEKYSGTTVNDLRVFMQKYKLHFAAAANPDERRLYPELYEVLFVQRDLVSEGDKADRGEK